MAHFGTSCSQVTVLFSQVHTGFLASPVEQHTESSDGLAICQSRHIAMVVIKMFPGTAEDKTGNNLDCLQQGFQHGLLEYPHIKLKRFEPGSESLKRAQRAKIMIFLAVENKPRHESVTDRPIVSRVIFITLLENWKIFTSFQATWSSPYFQDHSKIIERPHDDINQPFEYSQMNPIRPCRLTEIQLEQQIMQNIQD
ncbi:hypothetical protein HGM15179_004695 [Zosterops borbonicus]|uniref:Uncharacterized protein n=1 Tax=Zosterops borbonicus TaxID=364589 RepID=A0A8K1GPN9_9PASS|nr:hypothetical protein HGM15179_004695 [Zosterops borbonicus]